MIILKRKNVWKVFHDRRAPRDRRENRQLAEVSDHLADSFPLDFPLLVKREGSRRG